MSAKRTEWTIDLLGGFGLRVDGAAVTVSSLAARQLIAWLAICGRAQTRERAIGTIWPDLEEARARRQLSQALWRLRTDCGGISPIETTTLELALDPSARIDAATFARVIPAAGPGRIERLTELVDAYGGAFLEGMYDDWIIEERGALEHRYVDAVRELTGVLRSAGRLEDALTTARLWAQIRPLDEDAHRAVIALCALLGRVADGLAQYEVCRRTLDDELGVLPAPETEALLAQLNSDDITDDAADKTPSTRLVGRRRERAELVAAVDVVVAGHGQVLFVEGETGVGKTALLERFGHDATWRDVTVARSRCHLPSRPFGAVQDALDSVLTPLLGASLVDALEPAVTADLALVAPALGIWYPELVSAERLSGSAGRDRMLDALTSALVAIASFGPLAVIVDDVCLADADSLLVLERLADRIEQVPLLLCLAFRPDRLRSHEANWRTMRAIDTATAPERITVGPLPPRDSAALLDGLELDLTPEAIHLVLEAAGGSPLQLEELARAGATIDPTAPTPPEAGAGGGLRTVIARRVAQVDEQDRALVEVLAVVGHSVGLARLAQLGQLSLGRLAEGVLRLEKLGIVAVVGDRVALAHEPMLAAVYERIAEPQRIALHRHVLAVAIDLAGDDIEVLAFHARSGHMWAEAADFLRQAAERAVSLHAYETAAVQFEGAIDAARRASIGPAALSEILSGQVTVLDVLGRRSEQEEALNALEAATRSAGGSTVPVLVRQMDLYTRTDRFGEARKVAQTAAALARASRDPMDLYLARLALGQTQALGGRPAAAVHTLTAASLLVDSPDIRARVVHSLAIAHYQLGHLTAAIDGARLAATLSDEVGDHAARLEALALVAYGTFELGDTATALKLMEHALATAREVGYLHGAGVASVNLANLLSLTGKRVAALRHYGEGAAYLRRCGYRAGELAAVLNRASASQTVLGPASTSASEIASAIAWFDANLPGRYQVMARLVLAEHHLLSNRPAESSPVLDDAAAMARDLGDPALQLEVVSLTIELARQRGDWAAASRSHAAAADLARSIGLTVPSDITATGALAAAHLGHVHEADMGISSLIGDAWLPPAARLQAARAAVLVERHDLVAQLLALGSRDLRAALQGATPEQTEAALRDVPAHRELLDWYQRYEIQIQRVPLPLMGVPTGRPLAPHELVEVDLRISIPEDIDITDAAERRRERMRRLAEDAAAQNAYLRVADLAALLDVGPATVKRDLQHLRKTGAAVRTRGSRLDDPEVRETIQTSESDSEGGRIASAASTRPVDPEVER